MDSLLLTVKILPEPWKINEIRSETVPEPLSPLIPPNPYYTILYYILLYHTLRRIHPFALLPALDGGSRCPSLAAAVEGAELLLSAPHD